MKNPDQFGHNPGGHLINRDGILEIRVNVTTDMANTSVVSYFVQDR
jgi:hypothetical protein